MSASQRLYLHDELCSHCTARIIALQDGAFATDSSCFYPGGGGQPSDCGSVQLGEGISLPVIAAYADEDGLVWHQFGADASASDRPLLSIGQTVQLQIDAARRLVLSRYHTVLHVLNTIALRDYGGWMTGAQIGPDYSRIDFKIENFSRQLASELEAKVNQVISQPHAIRAFYLSEQDFLRRDDLLRTLKVAPPVVNQQVRVVEIAGFDMQACGGTHVHDTTELGVFSIFKCENNGKINKRFYVRLLMHDSEC